MQRLIIDDQGRVQDAAFHEWRANVDRLQTDAQFCDYLVRNASCVGLVRHGGWVNVRIRPTMTNQITLAATIYCIEDSRPRRITVSIFTGSDWLHHELGEPLRAIRSLLELLSQPEFQYKAPYSAHQHPLHRLPSDSAFHELLAMVSNVRRREDASSLANFLEARFESRYLIVDSDSEAGRLSVREVGNGFTYLDDVWRSTSTAHKMDTLPHSNYGAFTAQAYHTVRRSRSPLLEDIDTVLDGVKEGPLRLRYKRIIVPFADGNNGRLFLGATKMHSISPLSLGVRWKLGEIVEQ